MTDVKVGQVWKHNAQQVDYRIVGIYDHYAWCVSGIDTFSIKSFDWITEDHTLISDPDAPWLPLPDGYRLVTDEEREKHKCPDEYKYYVNAEWVGSSKASSYHRVKWTSVPHVIPCDHVWAEDKAQAILPFALALNTNREITNKINEIIAHINKEV